MKTIQLVISGRVQGVYFRAFVQKQAFKLNVVGFVRNRDDGAVEVVARAEDENMTVFINKCHKGPMMAKVKNIVINQYVSKEQFTQFDIKG